MAKIDSAGWNFDNSYGRLPHCFFTETLPTPVSQPQILILNESLGHDLGLESALLNSAEGGALFGGNAILSGMKPLAQAYAGHQFANFTMLGDGRAVLLGEHVTPKKRRVDIQLKGSGPTPFSRGGDGRAALGPMLREYIISEAMHALGIPTTRSLAVVSTGEKIFRSVPLPGAVLTRVAASHIRVGTFEYARARGNRDDLKTLADYTIARHFEESVRASNPYLSFLQDVVQRQATLIAKWQSVGFVHGVMNTDNMALSGETIDYGPCAFMDAYDPATVFSSIDRRGRYSYGNQTKIAQWNLARFAESLLPLLAKEESEALALAEKVVSDFSGTVEREWLSEFRLKLGLITEEDEDRSLMDGLLAWMHRSQCDFTTTFRGLSQDDSASVSSEAAFVSWHQRWSARLAKQSKSISETKAMMRAVNPAIIPRNHRVEGALDAAVLHGDFAPLQKLLEALQKPFDELPKFEEYRSPAGPRAERYRTFCGT